MRQGALAVVLVMSAVTALRGQDRGTISDSPWHWRWSPLQTIGGLGIPAAGEPRLPRVLDLPTPVVGLSWSARNPAGLTDDVGEPLAQMRLASYGTSGTYRSAIAPSRESVHGIEYGGWRPLGTRTAVIGRVAVARGNQGDGNQGIYVLPDESSPFVPTDTNAPPTSQTTVTLDGAQGIRMGAWRIGVALGYAGTSDNARESRIALIRRGGAGGASVGIARGLSRGLVLGVTARGLTRNETANAFANPGGVRINPLNGYLNVNPLDFTLQGAPYFQRADRAGTALGLNAAGAQWSAWVNRERVRERHVNAVANNTPVQRWSTEGWEGGAAARVLLSGVRTSVLATARTQRGTTRRAGSTSRQFEVEAHRYALDADARWRPDGSAWEVAAAGRGVHQKWKTDDRGARTSADVSAWSPAGSLEVARSVRTRWSWSAGLGMATYTPSATIPPTTARADSWLEVLAPIFEMSAAPARSTGFHVGLRHVTGGRTAFLRVGGSTLVATERATNAFLLPKGSRVRWSLSGGIGQH